ncbi:MAG: fljL [Caulobacteraceae bacterium]|jgi:flagellin|nr:fljL [Caulobacteraceae bacterium]
MAISVHTNTAALVALQNLNTTNEKLTEAQSRISTGLKIANAKDNAAVWSIAQDQRASIGALNAVKMSLDRATSVAQVTMSAGESVSDLLVQIKEKVVAAMDPSISASSRQALNSDFKSLLRQISQVVQAADFNGSNILDGSLTADIKFLANESATNFITLSVKNMTLGNSIITVGSTASIGTMTVATTVLARIDASLANVNSALGDVGAQAKQIENHTTFVNKLTDVLETGVGNLVDADLAKESANLQALQVQQQLGAQALSIANTAPQIILSLFRGG